jgi:hypothetical protein
MNTSTFVLSILCAGFALVGCSASPTDTAGQDPADSSTTASADSAAAPTDDRLPLTISSNGNTYVIDDFSVATGEDGNTVVSVTGSGFSVMPMRNGQFVIPVYCAVTASGQEVEFGSINTTSTGADFIFKQHLSPDSVIFYPQDDRTNRFVFDYE